MSAVLRSPVLRAARRLVVMAAAGAAAYMAACANPSVPPGGAPDTAPPLLLSLSPANNATQAKNKSVEVKFDEVISETPRGVQNLADLVFISPKSGKPVVSWGRTRLTIRPAKGWKPNTVYSVQIKQGIVDLRGNALDSAIRVVFSTGQTIPDTRVEGVVFDWGLGRGLSGSVVEAIAPDSTTYQVVADTAGRYQLRNLPPGPYLLRAFGDKNTNRDLDPLELWDSVRVTVVQSTSAEFYAFQHDTVGLRISDIALQDSGRTLKVAFDKPFSPSQLFPTSSVRILGPDSLAIPVKAVQTTRGKQLIDSITAKVRSDSVERVQRAKEDSTPGLRARNDSLARVRRADSVAAADRSRREQERAAAREAARNRGRGARPPAARDTTPPPKMNRPLVYNEIFISLDSLLPPQKQFRVQIVGVRSLSEISKSPSRTFTTPRAPKVDSAAARRDSTAAPVRRDTTAAPVRRDTTAVPVRRDTAAARPRRDTTAVPVRRDTMRVRSR